jgi:hypothetical protein
MTALNRRDAVFRELQTLVHEYDEAVSSQNPDVLWNVDDALSDIIIRLNGETRRIRKFKKTERTEAARSAA